MFYSIYKITNKISGKIYIGKHKTKDLNDGYMGSGKLINAAIKKYGIENFEKEIIFQFDNEADMNSKEAELVTEDFVKENTNYNLCPGGNGGFGYINSNKEIIAKRDKYEHKLAGRIAANKVIEQKYGSLIKLSKDAGMLGAKAYSKKYHNDKEFKNKVIIRLNDANIKSQSVESKVKRKRTMESKGHSKGNKNPQYGKRWIHSLELKKSMMLSKEVPLPDGWLEGRKIKF